MAIGDITRRFFNNIRSVYDRSRSIRSLGPGSRHRPRRRDDSGRHRPGRNPQGTTFDHPVYPQIESITTGETLGSGSPKSVTLPTADGDYTSDLLTWSFKPGSKWAAETASTMYCTMFYTPVPGTAGTKVSMGRVEVVRSGVTGIDDVTVGDTNPYTEVYTLTGVRIAAGVDVDLNALGRGVYIVRSAKGISKIVL